MRTIDVNGLGWDAAIIDIEGEQVLLLDAALETDDRIAVLSRAMANA